MNPGGKKDRALRIRLAHSGGRLGGRRFCSSVSRRDPAARVQPRLEARQGRGFALGTDRPGV